MVHPSLADEGGGHGSRGNAVAGTEAGGGGGGVEGKESEGADVAQGEEGYYERESGVRKALTKKDKSSV